MVSSTPRPRRARRLVSALAALAVAGAAALTGIGTASSAEAAGDPVLGAYSGELLLAPGADKVRHIDIPGTVAKLTSANINTFAYVIYGYGAANTDPSTSSTYHTTAGKATQAQWDDLPAFLSAAETAGIDVWVYMVPPSESAAGYTTSTYAPFYWDYVKWGDEIGKVAAVHTNLKAIVMDDFGGNAVASSPWSFTFTPTNVAEMRAAARSHAPWVMFLPAIYYCQVHGNGSIVSTYRTIVDGIVGAYNGSPSCTWWSGDGTTVPNTTDASLADLHLRLESSMVKCKSAGCIELGVPFATPTSAGGWTSTNQTISVSGSGTKKLSFWTNDDWIGGSPGGYHMLQVLVDGTVVWQEDASTWKDWHQSTVDLTTALAGKTTAQLTLRLYEQAGVSNWHISAWFDSLEPTGFTLTNPGFDTSLAGWTGTESHALFEQRWVPSQLMVPMVYAARLADVEPNPTTAAYTLSVTNTALDLYDEGVTDGLLLYNMNMTGAANGLGDPTTITGIGTLFGGY